MVRLDLVRSKGEENPAPVCVPGDGFILPKIFKDCRKLPLKNGVGEKGEVTILLLYVNLLCKPRQWITSSSVHGINQ
ncbi:hypothetical protein L6164_005318 [Bauhinia variegata]|uniref:Uncharacterized protein n=1 Tax=Bauhinia variegata TaxID=167791 RepID=A0ACB9PWE0_BAUVA|nr:hypothetical protein L6164_005318 [Bauhinia variegata]